MKNVSNNIRHFKSTNNSQVPRGINDDFINKKIKIELGYLSQIQTNKSRGQFQMAVFTNY